MSNYSQITYFAPKDALLSGNPAKLIQGATIDPELAAISTAIASKYDSANFLAANPSGAVGLAAANGVATTWMRSDAAPALSQAISPNWTGSHLFSGAPTTVGTTTGASAGALSGVGALHLYMSTGGADQTIWRAINDPTFQIQTVNDAYNATKTALQFTRTGMTITGVILGNATDKPTITLNGPVTIPAPASGAGLNVTGIATSNAVVMQINDTTTGAQASQALRISRSGSTANTLGLGPVLQLQDGLGGCQLQFSGGQTELWQYNGAWAQMLYIPSAGTTLVVGAGTTGGQRGDIAVARTGATTTGCTFFGSAGSAYLFFDGAAYNFGGTGTIKGTAFQSTSDRALKTNIKLVDSALSKLHKLRGVTFNWKASGQPSAGLIAQDVEKVLPEAIGSYKHNAATSKRGRTYKTVNYNAVLAVLVEAVKELSAEVEALKAA